MNAWELVAAAQAGDSDAFGELFRAYHLQVFRFVLNKVEDTHTAEDLTADVFLKAWQSIGSVTDQGRDVVAWLITIARNRVIDHYRITVRRQDLAPQIPMQPHHRESTPLVGPEVIVLDRLTHDDSVARLQGYLEQLPDTQREALRLRYDEELTGGQVSEAMGCGLISGRMYQARGRRTLRTRLTEDGYTCVADFQMPHQRVAS